MRASDLPWETSESGRIASTAGTVRREGKKGRRRSRKCHGEWRSMHSVPDAKGRQIAATDTPHSAAGVTKPQGESAQAVRGWHQRKNLQRRMQDRACRTMVCAMAIAVGDRCDAMMREQPEQLPQELADGQEEFQFDDFSDTEDDLVIRLARLGIRVER